MENTPSPASKEELSQEEVQVVGKKIERHCLILVTIKMIIKSEHVCLKENYKQQQLQKNNSFNSFHLQVILLFAIRCN